MVANYCRLEHVRLTGLELMIFSRFLALSTAIALARMTAISCNVMPWWPLHLYALLKIRASSKSYSSKNIARFVMKLTVVINKIMMRIWWIFQDFWSKNEGFRRAESYSAVARFTSASVEKSGALKWLYLVNYYSYFYESFSSD